MRVIDYNVESINKSLLDVITQYKIVGIQVLVSNSNYVLRDRKQSLCPWKTNRRTRFESKSVILVDSCIDSISSCFVHAFVSLRNSRHDGSMIQLCPFRRDKTLSIRVRYPPAVFVSIVVVMVCIRGEKKKKTIKTIEKHLANPVRLINREYFSPASR